MNAYARILLVEDDHSLATVLRDTLTDAGFECRHTDDGMDGLTLGTSQEFDLAILDVNLPSLSGLDLCRELKRAAPELSVIMLTARVEETDVIGGLETGADDYLTKPISPSILVARVRARLREKQRVQRMLQTGKVSSEPAAETIDIGNLHIDLEGTRIYSCGKELELTSHEYDFLALLAMHPGRTFYRDELLSTVWQTENHNSWPNVTVMVSRLRSKLAHDPLADRYLVTVRGRGYRFARPEELSD